jgi:hypothetical protein
MVYYGIRCNSERLQVQTADGHAGEQYFPGDRLIIEAGSSLGRAKMVG